MASASTTGELATRADLDALGAGLRQEMSAHRTESREDMQALRTESRADMQTLRTEFREDISELRADVRTWATATIGLTAAVAVGAIGAIVTLTLTLD